MDLLDFSRAVSAVQQVLHATLQKFFEDGIR